MIKLLEALKEQMDDVKLNCALNYDEFCEFSQLYGMILRFIEVENGKEAAKVQSGK